MAAKGKSFSWDLEATKTLLSMCLDYQKANGVKQPFSWVSICEELEQKIGKKCCYKSVRNKFDHTKKLWLLWKKLRRNETGIGPVEGRIVADGAWWDRKIKENDQYKQFRRKGVPPEIDDLCERIFGTIEADGGETETHSQYDLGNLPTYSEDEQLQADEGQSEAHSQFEADGEGIKAQPISIRVGLVSDAQPEVYGPNASKPKSPTRSKLKDSNGGRLSSFPVLAKRKRDQYPNLTLIDEAGLKMLGILEVAAPEEKCTLDDAMLVIERLLKEGSLVEGSPLWCFGLDEMLKDDVRRVFLSIARDSGRLSWLQWRFQLAHPEMHSK